MPLSTERVEYVRKESNQLASFAQLANDPHWVCLNNLYVSITVTGDSSWGRVVQDHYIYGQRSFRVLTGRHGDQLGAQLIPGTNVFMPRAATDWAIDPDNDRAAATVLRNQRNDLELIVIDVARYNTIDRLKMLIEPPLFANCVVILAWCYSLWAMEAGWDVTTNLHARTRWTRQNYDRPINSFQHAWRWALKYPPTHSSMIISRKARW